MRIDYNTDISGSVQDSITIYRDPTDAGEGNNIPVYSNSNQGNMSFNAIGLTAGDHLDSCLWDEIRIGTTWEDVIGSAPAFVSQPRSQNPMAGDSINLSAQAASDLPLSYQWYHGSAPLSGQTDTNLALSNIQTGDGGGYYVIATDSPSSVTSMVAQVTVRSPDMHYLLAYEGFDYAAGTNNLAGKNGGAGWSNGWQTIGGPAGNVFSESASGSMVADTNAPSGYDSHSRGNAGYVQNGSRSGRWLDSSSNGTFGMFGLLDPNNHIGADGKTVYLSFMLRSGGTNAPHQFYEFEFKRNNLGDAGRIAGIGNNAGTANTNVNLRAPALVTDQSLGAGDTNVNFYVVRIDYVGGADNVYVYRNPTGTSESDNTPTIVKMGVTDMSLSGISLAAYGAGIDITGDEIRMGLSWEDAVGTAPLDFIVQPQGQTVYLPQDSLTLSSLAVSDQTISYQWYHDGNPVGTGADLVLSNVQPGDGGNYWVVASTAGTESTSAVARLEMNVLRIDQQPQNQAAALGNSLTLTLGASGIPPLNYQWFKDNSPITGATNANYCCHLCRNLGCRNLLLCGRQRSDEPDQFGGAGFCVCRNQFRAGIRRIRLSGWKRPFRGGWRYGLERLVADYRRARRGCRCRICCGKHVGRYERTR